MQVQKHAALMFQTCGLGSSYLRKGPRHEPTVGSQGGIVSYERGTPVTPPYARAGEAHAGAVCRGPRQLHGPEGSTPRTEKEWYERAA